MKHSAPSAGLWGSSPPLRPGCVFGCRFASVNTKQPSTGSLRGGWGLHPARWCEVRGCIPSASLVCWEGDLEMKHSAPSADSGAQANLPDLVGFRHDFPPLKEPSTRSGRGVWGLHLARWCEVRGCIPSARLACSEGDLNIKHPEPSGDSWARANLRPGRK